MSDTLDALTEKEKETLRLIVRGHGAKSAACELDLSVHTINERLRSARRKLGVTSSREAARLLLESEANGNESLVTKQMGDALTDVSTDQLGVGRFRPWLIGGVIVVSLIFALTLAFAPSGIETGPKLPNNAETRDNAKADTAMQSAPPTEVLDPLETVARDWLTFVDANDWKGGFEASSMPNFIDLATFENAMRQSIEPLGAVTKRELLQFGAVKASSIDYRLVQFTTDFENKESVIETVTLVQKDGRYEVGGYWIK
ncbi:DUF4019 domain-containing protein [Erythrobacter sp. MTPC3]|uniref:DUF4019 domain-containing protein n=1 Tax=Erythrobacter sp. MTPC3 TaxID=3056564 RepID=UPI0036F24DE8